MTDHPDQSIETKVARLAEKFHGLVNEWAELEKSPKEFGTGQPLSVTEIHTIDAIGKHPEINVNGLAKHMDVTRSAASQMVSRLESKGLVAKYKAEGNAKEVRLALTPVGWIGYKEHDAFHRKAVDIFREYYGSDIDNGLTRLNRSLQELNDIVALYTEMASPT